MTSPPVKRKPGKPRQESEKMTTLTFRGYIRHRDKLQKLGGAAWIRKQIDAAIVE